jgi:hypothetical protein
MTALMRSKKLLNTWNCIRAGEARISLKFGSTSKSLNQETPFPH